MVIQRWQSLLLLLTAGIMACFTFMSLGQIQLPEATLDFTTIGFKIEGESTGGAPSGYALHTWGFFTVSLLSVVIPLIALFSYKNLRLQKNLCLIEILMLIAAVTIGAAYGYYHYAVAQVSWSSLIIAPALAFISDVMACNRIVRDQKLLRSVDRIR